MDDGAGHAESEKRIRTSFDRQGLMSALGATVLSIAPGEIAIIPHAAISQQHGFVHAGAVTAIADSAAGTPR